jgi:Transposase, Mutator family
MLSLAIEAEVADFLAVHADRVDQTGRRRLVRHGHAPKRSIQTGIGPSEVQRPRVRDRGANDESERIGFTSAVLPAYLRRTRNIEELLPWLYLKGISTGQFEETLHRLAGAEPAWPFGGDDPPLGGRLAGRAAALAGPRPVGEAVCLRLGGRISPAAGSSPMSATSSWSAERVGDSHGAHGRPAGGRRQRSVERERPADLSTLHQDDPLER